ncbi:alpha/beta hydrolase [Vibrio sp. 99-70-13A1]|nr:alpha/beta hydrolase [Vibrio sp. 99-70-13A1]
MSLIYQLPITNYQLPITNFFTNITNYQLYVTSDPLLARLTICLLK